MYCIIVKTSTIIKLERVALHQYEFDGVLESDLGLHLGTDHLAPSPTGSGNGSSLVL